MDPTNKRINKFVLLKYMLTSPTDNEKSKFRSKLPTLT